MRRSFYLSLFAMLFVACGVVRADPITSLDFEGDGSIGRYTGHAEYSTVTDTLTITLNTLQTEPAGGSIIGFGFNSLVTGLHVDLVEAPSGFSGGLLSAPPYGDYGFGAQGGVLVSVPETFTFKVTGDNVGAINGVHNFFAAGSTVVEPFVAELQNGQITEFVPDSVVPLPPTAWAGLTLFGVFGVGNRFYSRRSTAA